jgi:hypothetical protein
MKARKGADVNKRSRKNRFYSTKELLEMLLDMVHADHPRSMHNATRTQSRWMPKTPGYVSIQREDFSQNSHLRNPIRTTAPLLIPPESASALQLYSVAEADTASFPDQPSNPSTVATGPYTPWGSIPVHVQSAASQNPPSPESHSQASPSLLKLCFGDRNCRLSSDHWRQTGA